MKITTNAFTEMLKTVGSQNAEAGGLLFGSRKDWVITKFLYDRNAVTTVSTYSFDVGYLNPMIDKLEEEGLQLLGFLHSHPQNCTNLSQPDIQYFLKQFSYISVDKFLVPLMFSAVDGTHDFIPYTIYKDGRVEQSELELLPDQYDNYVVPQPELLPPIPTIAGESIPQKMSFRRYYLLLWSTFLTGGLIFLLCSLWLIFQYLFHHFKISTL